MTATLIEARPLVEVLPPTKREQLLRAIDLIETNGWTRGNAGMPDYHTEDAEPLCLVGSIQQARADLGLPRISADDHARMAGFDCYSDAYMFNDSERRTKDEVLAVLRREAEAA